MTKVIIQEKFNTSMGLVFRVKNDQVFKVDQIVEVEKEKYKISRIMFPTNPNDVEFVNLIVLKAS